MTPSTTPFIVENAEVALWTTDSYGALATQLYLGGSAEAVQFEDAFKERTLYYPGVPTGSVFHEDEVFTVEMKNVWLHQRLAGNVAQMPTPLLRNVALVLVIAWYDEDAGVWCNRTYTGVKGKSKALDGRNTFQTVSFTAETMSETAGLGEPVTTPLTYGEVRYVDGGTFEVLYRLGIQTGALQPIDPARLTHTAAISLATPGEATITFAGASGPALTATASALTAGSLVALGNTILDEEPRLEFWIGQTRVAALGSDGTLAVPDLLESATPPAGGLPLFAGDVWLCTFDAVTAAPSFNEAA